MLVKNNNYDITFGWKGLTHEALSEAAVDKINGKLTGLQDCVELDSQVIKSICVLPDQEEHLPHSHSADITSPKDGDALCVFKAYDKQVKEALRNKNYKGLNNLIARIFHQLQDICDPAHAIDYLEIPQTRTDQAIHLKIETEAKKLQKSVIKKAGKNVQDLPANFDEILRTMMLETKDLYSAIRDNMAKKRTFANKMQLEILISKSLMNSFKISFAYLKELMNYL